MRPDQLPEGGSIRVTPTRPENRGSYAAPSLAEAGIAPSVDSVGDALANALAEIEIGLFKIELAHHRSPRKSLDDVELACGVPEVGLSL